MLEAVMPVVYGGIGLLVVLCLGLVIWLSKSIGNISAPAPESAKQTTGYQAEKVSSSNSRASSSTKS